ncbi:uncharacterized protein FOMMEDRAFT_158055 [Fomitiporia mediterranea MF3/22]|uniref:uncharacterized protein n=1 Tax=Fomitiporia mediterranea (strain MF3/22) TaxID=694068 RepID=UPI00044075C1|nr:uncharacterized protein FOMMEDRAFT_158055 [Fomitiporia mediterranea MF3/22]EJD00939.1 hypothetical protein FOMMEDRAFT_158055 [Fomitiporia mediterranea MF3/22]
MSIIGGLVSKPDVPKALVALGNPMTVCIIGCRILLNLKEAGERDANGGTLDRISSVCKIKPLMSTFDSLVADLTRDAYRVQPKDALQFCANWFQTRLEEQPTCTHTRYFITWYVCIYLTRIDKPIGTLLMFYPCAWPISMAAYALQTPINIPLAYTGLFGLGALIMRGAGCTINDMWARHLDKAVKRTKERPLARSDIIPTQALQVPWPSTHCRIGCAPPTKLAQYTSWCIVLLCYHCLPIHEEGNVLASSSPQLAFNWGALLGWSAVAGSVNWGIALPLYAGGICWTLVYDRIYAHQDKTDDRTSLSLITCASYLNAHGALYYAGVGLAGVQLARQAAGGNLIVLDERDSVCMAALADFLALGTGFW